MTIKVEVIDQGPLTDREAEIARLMVEGHADKAIAQVLAISIKTVNAHISNIYLKLQVHYDASIANTAGINTRCRAVSMMIARRLVSVSVKAMLAMLMFQAAVPDDDSVNPVNRHRTRHGRARAHISQLRRGSNA